MSFPIRPDLPVNTVFTLNRIPMVEALNAASSQAFQQAGNRGYLPLLSPGTVLSPFPSLEMLTSKTGRKDSKGNIRVRWPLMAMPLKIYIPEAALAFADQVMAQAMAWETASVPQGDTQPTIRFQRVFTVNESHPPDIVISFDAKTALGRDYETGHTDRKVDAKGFIQGVEITLIEQPAVYAHLSPGMQAACLEATLLHELGHALGLEHSEHKADVMYYRGWQNTNLTQGDIAALQALYSRRETLLG